MLGIRVAGAGGLMLGLAGCGNATPKTLQEEAEGRDFDGDRPGRRQLPRVKVGDSLTEIDSRVAVVAITLKA